MRELWKSGLALSLGLLTNGAWAGGDAWRPVAVGADGRPIAAAQRSAGPAVTLGRPIATLERPVPLPDGDRIDPFVQPTGFRAGVIEPTVTRGVAPERSIARPMPIGPAAPGAAAAGLHAWGRTVEPPTSAADGSAPPEIAPAPTSTGPVPGPIVGPPMVGAGVTGPFGRSLWSRFGGSLTCDPCGDVCCPTDCGDNCCFGNRWYVGMEYLAWWFKASPTPPLVTAGNPTDAVPVAVLGPDHPNTVVLFGGSNVSDQMRSGGRLYFGYWFNDDHCLGVDFGGFGFTSNSDQFAATSFGNPVLGRPANIIAPPGLTDFVPGVEGVAGPPGVFNAASPGVVGRVSVDNRSSLWGVEGNLRSNVCCGCNFSLDLLGGVRCLGLDEDLQINEAIMFTTVSPGSTIAINDHFQTQNRFYGGQIGAIAEYRRNRWVFDMKTKVAFGATQQMVNITGSTAVNDVNVPANSFSAPGGFLALSSNMGHYTQSKFAVIPEVGFNIGYMLTERMRIFAGYSILYWSSVARPGVQIDPNVNANLVPRFGGTPGGQPARPVFDFREADFWAQGVNFGLEFRY